MGNSLDIISINEALKGFKLDDNDRCFTLIDDKKIERFRLMGRVVLKFLNNEKTYGTLTLDDETATIVVKFFSSNIHELERTKLGDLVEISGKMGIFQEQIHIISDSCGTLDDVNYEFLRKLEVSFKVDKQEQIMLERIKETKGITFELLELEFKDRTKEILSNLLDKGDVYESSPKTYSSV